MKRNDVVQLALDLGFTQWGRLRTYGHGNDSPYQCFRRRNDYAWIGNFYVEVSTNPIACDYVHSERNEVRLFLEGIWAIE